MTFSIADLSTILNRILDRATDNLSIEKLLFQLGLDPNNITYSALFDRLSDVIIANINVANICALIGAAFFVATLLTRTMVPLRVFGIVSALFFMAFGALAHDIKTFLLYLLLLPINVIRLYQMITLVKKARSAMQGDTSMEWLKPFMTQRKYRRGDVLFNKGDAAKEMFLTVTGKFLVAEIGVELPPGRLMGELGFLTPDNRRTATVRCTEAGQVLTITYEKLLELYFQNPQFGYYFLVLTSQRLLQNIARLEGVIASAPDKAALMRPIEAHDGDAVASAQREAPSTMEGRVIWTGAADFAGSHRATPGRSACERCQSRQTFFRVVWSCRNYSGAVRRPRGRRRNPNSNATPHFADLPRAVFSKSRQNAGIQSRWIDDTDQQRHRSCKLNKERAGRWNCDKRHCDAGDVRRRDLRDWHDLHPALRVRRDTARFQPRRLSRVP